MPVTTRHLGLRLLFATLYHLFTASLSIKSLSLPLALLCYTAHPDDDLSLGAAIEATEHLTLRDLAAHVHVGPLPPGTMTPLTLALREQLVGKSIFVFTSVQTACSCVARRHRAFRLNRDSPALKHFVDIIYDVPGGTVNPDNLKAIIRDKAWDEIRNVLKMKERPVFDYVCQYFLLPRTNGQICIVKHVHIKQDKVKGNYIMRVLQGSDYEIAWGTQNKHKARRGLPVPRNGRSSELSEAHLDLDEAYCFSTLFPPAKHNKVQALIIDDNQKLKMQCSEAPAKRRGRPRKSNQTVGHYTNGWMFACDLQSGRILSLQSMHEPESNDVAAACIENCLWLYPKVDCVIYDRACAFQARGEACPGWSRSSTTSWTPSTLTVILGCALATHASRMTSRFLIAWVASSHIASVFTSKFI